MNEILSERENIVTESIRAYLLFSVSLHIKLKFLSSGSDESIPYIEAGDVDLSDLREAYVF